MTRNYRTEVVVLNSWKSKERDRIYLVFSREYGLMRVVGVGVRKMTAKLAFGLEPFTRSDIFLVGCRYLDKVKGVVVLRQYFSLKQNLDYLILGRRTMGVLAELLPDGEPNETIFVATKKYLKLLNHCSEAEKLEEKTRSDIGHLGQLSLLWKAIYQHGYFPRISRCIYCSQKIVEKEEYVFVLSKGISCGCQNIQSNDLRFNLRSNVFKLLKFLVSQDIEMVKKLRVRNDDLTDLQKFTRLILEQILERRVIL